MKTRTWLVSFPDGHAVVEPSGAPPHGFAMIDPRPAAASLAYEFDARISLPVIWLPKLRMYRPGVWDVSEMPPDW